MTKCTIIGETSPKEGKPIEFLGMFTPDTSDERNTDCARVLPSDWNNIELVCPADDENLDVMFAYDTDRSCGVVYSGHWNGGYAQ